MVNGVDLMIEQCIVGAEYGTTLTVQHFQREHNWVRSKLPIIYKVCQSDGRITYRIAMSIVYVDD